MSRLLLSGKFRLSRAPLARPSVRAESEITHMHSARQQLCVKSLISSHHARLELRTWNVHFSLAKTCRQLPNSLLFRCLSTLDEENIKLTHNNEDDDDPIVRRIRGRTGIVDEDVDSDDEEEEEREDEEAATDVVEPLFQLGNSPLWTLNDYYRNQHGISNISTHMEAELVTMKEKGSYWTVLFTCPMSGKVYQSGTLRGTDEDSEKRDTIVDDDGRVLYRKKKEAVQAASARALDRIQYDKLKITEPRICEEDPSEEDNLLGKEFRKEDPLAEAVSILQSSKTDIAQAARSWETGEESSTHLTDKPLEIVDEILTESQSPELQTSTCILFREEKSNPDREEVDGEEETEYIISYIPAFDGRSPSQRILEAASRGGASFGLESSNTESSSVTMLPKFTTSNRRRLLVAIETAKTWVDYNRNTSASSGSKDSDDSFISPHRIDLAPVDSPTKLLVGKTILKALAEANQGQPIHVDSGVEPIANRILDVLWQTDNAKPDAACYTAYLRCLGGDDPVRIADRAHEIVQAMRNGTPWQGHTLPKPDQSTYNALVQLTAQVGGITGRFANTSDDFVPDRQSFLSVLSSATYKPAVIDEKSGRFESGGFDPDFAKQCIEKMEQMANDLGDESLRPDIDVYNAPLRWAGGDVYWRKSRPYARYIAWDRYHKIHGSGYRRNVNENNIEEDGHFFTQDAVGMDKWLKEMKESSSTGGVGPNIETYEAVIQSWLRTLTREGQDRADSLANELLESTSSVQPRLQSFHPIVASWFHAKDADSLEKVVGWVDRLHKISEENNRPELRPDMRMISIQMKAFVSRQEVLLEKLRLTSDEIDEDSNEGNVLKNDDSDKSRDSLSAENETAIAPVHAILQEAELCRKILDREIELLEDAVASGEVDTYFLDTSLFAECIRGWQNVALAFLMDGKQDEGFFDRALGEIDSVVADFERIVETVVKLDTTNGINLGSGKEVSTQLKHMIASGQCVFSAVLESIKAIRNLQISSKNEKVSTADIHSATLLLVEQMVRRVIEMDEIEVQGEVFPSDVSSPDLKVRYDDLFEYYSGDNRDYTSKKAFMWQVIEFADQPLLQPSQLGDVVRLCFLMKEFARARKKSQLIEAVDRLLDRLLPGSKNREQQHVLSRMPANQIESESSSGSFNLSKSKSRPRSRRSGAVQKRAQSKPGRAATPRNKKVSASQ